MLKIGGIWQNCRWCMFGSQLTIASFFAPSSTSNNTTEPHICVRFANGTKDLMHTPNAAHASGHCH